MKKQKIKPLSTILGASISGFGIFFESWTAKSFIWGGGTTAPIVYLLPIGLAIACAILTYIFVKRYARNQQSNILLVLVATFFAFSGFIFNAWFLASSFQIAPN